MRKSNAGFTLVELIVAIAASALVIGAALSFMLFGLRMDNAANKTVSVQSDSRIIMRTLENIAAEGEIGEIKTFNKEMEQSAVKWALYPPIDPENAANSTNYESILSFNADDGTICGKAGVVIVDGILDSVLSYENNVLSCTIETESGEKYTSSVYCRVGTNKVLVESINPEKESDKTISNIGTENKVEFLAREKFITTIFSQYGSTGIIEDETDLSGYEFATWYWAMNLRNDSEIWTETPEKVPWCAIFVSWALNKTVESLRGYTIYDNFGNVIAEIQDKPIPQNIDALVDNVMWYQFDRISSDNRLDPINNKKFADVDEEDKEKHPKYWEMKDAYEPLGEWKYPYYNDGKSSGEAFTPKPGDLVFFENDSSNDRADHLGVVLYIENNKLFVVEGNHNDTVGIFAYEYKPVLIHEEEATTYSDGNSHVIGYGVIKWDELLPQVETNVLNNN